MNDLTKNEEIIILSIWKLKEDAYGVSIKNHIKRITGKEWNYGTLYCTLDQLVKKGLLQKREGMPMSERGGRRKIYYTLTVDGEKALRTAHALNTALWDGITAVVLERGK